MHSRCLIGFMLGFLALNPAGAVPPPAPPPSSVQSVDLDGMAARIDQAALQFERLYWLKATERTPPSQRQPLTLPPVAMDEVFIRRAYLDLQARLPDPATVRAFLASTHPQKRAVLVDRLLADPMAGARRFLRLADMLRVKDSVMGFPMRPYVEWLREAAGRSMPYDEMVKALITSSGDLAKAPASGFLMTDAGSFPVTMGEMMRVFLDQNMQCAACHDHPFADTTQMQYYRLAACLTSAEVVKVNPAAGVTTRLASSPEAGGAGGEQEGVAPGEFLRVQPATAKIPIFLPKIYLYRDGKPGQAVKAGLPIWGPKGMGELVPAMPVPGKDGEVAVEFANWLVGSQRFAEVAALRTWRELFGTPLPDGESRLGEENHGDKSPAEVNELRSCEGAGPRSTPYRNGSQFGVYLDNSWGPAFGQFAAVLGMELKRLRFDLREFERVLARTQAYQRQAQLVSMGERGYVFAPAFRRLPAETIWNNLMLIQTDGASAGKALLSHELPQVPDEAHPSRALGRGDRRWGDDSLRAVTQPLVRMMMTGDVVKKVSAPDGPLVWRLKSIPHADLAVEEVFLAVLGRLPTQKEKLATLDYCIENPGTGWSDTVWSLINTSEFVFQF